MYVGIDVGGTFTDGVVISKNQILRKIKVLTQKDNLIKSLVETLDVLLCDLDYRGINKITFSTTIITNLVAEDLLEPVALLLIPGPGLDPHKWNFNCLTKVISGMVDFRGREITPVSQPEVFKSLSEIDKEGYKKVVVAGKFAQRNNAHELQVSNLIKRKFPSWQVELSHQVSGELNYPRRIATALLNLATKEAYQSFVQQVQQALDQRGVSAPAFVLKADGGTLPLSTSSSSPIETIYSGPAASMLGVLALTETDKTSVVLDIGGTTTDIGLVIAGTPLLATQGIEIKNYATHVRAFNVKAIAIGGDSLVEVKNGKFLVGPRRKGPAYCLGGPSITPTDALRYLGQIKIGCLSKAEEGLAKIGKEFGLSSEEVAKHILDVVIKKIVAEVTTMYKQWELEPAYRIWEITQRKEKTTSIIGVGGGAQGIVPLIGKAMNVKVNLPDNFQVANAIGAATALPTVTVTLRIDTEQGFYTHIETGTQEALPYKRFTEEHALELARHLLKLEERKVGIISSPDCYKLISQESFSVIRGNYKVGKIIDLKLQTLWKSIFNIQGDCNVD